MANKLFNTTDKIVDLKAVADLGSEFESDQGGLQRQRGRGLDDLLTGVSGVSLNTLSAPTLTSSSQTLPIIPYSIELPERDETEVIRDNNNDQILVPLSLEMSDTSHNKGSKKGAEKPFDFTSRDDGISGNQGRDPVSPFDRGKPEMIGDRGGGPPEGKGPSGDHGGGEPEEPAGNNLSHPVIWSEGEDSGLTVPGTAGAYTFTTPYDVNGDGIINNADQIDGYYQFAQKTDGNLWQAESFAASAPVYITEVDWGDSLEAVDMNVGRPIRVELSLYKNLEMTYTGEATLPEQMLAFPMTMLANPSSPDEVQGAGAATFPLNGTALPDSLVNTTMLTEATVYSADAQLIIQKLEGSRDDVAEGDLLWNGSQWLDGNVIDPTDISDPLTGITFAGELNVGGKVIYGLSQGGWQPTEVGDYRITFYIAPDANAQLDYATIRLAAEEELTAIASEDGEEGGDTGGGNAFVVGDLNLTYIDISVVDGGGIGDYESQTDSLGDLDFNAIASESSGLVATNDVVI